MTDITKIQPLVILVSAVFGVALGQLILFEQNAGSFIEPLLMMMLFFTFLIVDLKKIGRSFTNVKFSVTSLCINFIWTPIFAFILGILFFNGNIDAKIGLMMLLATPCTDWYLIFTGIAKGNVPLGASILPLNLVLQMALLPIYLLVFMGNSVSFDIDSLLMSIVLVLVVPLVTANAIRYSLKRNGKWPSTEKILSQHGDNLQLLFLCLAIIAMFASQGKALMNNPMLFLEMLIPLGIFFVVNFFIAQWIGRKLHMPFDDIKTLNMTTLARNSPLALAIAVVAFPDDPLISLILVIGPLIELPVLALVARILIKMDKNEKITTEAS